MAYLYRDGCVSDAAADADAAAAAAAAAAANAATTKSNPDIYAYKIQCFR